jgi:hypothetical protein
MERTNISYDCTASSGKNSLPQVTLFVFTVFDPVARAKDTFAMKHLRFTFANQ